MTNPELMAKLKLLSRTYPKWMDLADFQESQDFQRHVGRASAWAKRDPSKKRWDVSARGIIRDFELLELQVQGRAA